MVVLCVPIPLPISSGDIKEKDEHRKSRDAQTRSRNICLVATAVCLTLFVFAVRYDLQNSVTIGASAPEQKELARVEVGSARKENPCLTNLFVDLQFAKKRIGTPAPRISIIFITKRPGGYDFLLHSLHAQKLTGTQYEDTPHSQLYELICVDELAAYRSRRIYEMARELNVPLVAVAPSKPKAAAFMNSHFNIYNAVNTGLLFARGEIVTFVMDYSWLPANYIARTLEFYDQPQHKKSFLAYPEMFFRLMQSSMPPPSAMTDWDSVTLFPENNTQPLSLQFPARFSRGYSRPADLVTDFLGSQPHGFEKQPRINSPQGRDTFWELSFASCPFSALEALNGAEEMWDVGDDSHEANIRLRAEFLGYDLWVDGQTIVECMWHKNHLQPQGDLWNRFQENTVSGPVIITEMGQIHRHERSVVSAGHEFNLTLWRKYDCPANMAA
eukprot:c9931_g1_i1.p1 GENE.c9931_g1_i1~~c9931_g1_i1.p1  ORF type:complete len:442 (-),score=105.22 c9931_g1_i1:40-1365(-)